MPTPTGRTQKVGLLRGSGAGVLGSDDAAEGRDQDGAAALRRLKVVGVALPVLFILSRAGSVRADSFRPHRQGLLRRLRLPYRARHIHAARDRRLHVCHVPLHRSRPGRDGPGSSPTCGAGSARATASTTCCCGSRTRMLSRTPSRPSPGTPATCWRATRRPSASTTPRPDPCSSTRRTRGRPPCARDVRISPEADGSYSLHDLHLVRSLRSSPEFRESLQVPIQSRDTSARRAVDRPRSRSSPSASATGGFSRPSPTSPRSPSRARGCARTNGRARSSPSASGSPARCTTASPRSSARPTSGCARSARAPTSGAAGDRGRAGRARGLCEEAYRDVREAILDLRESSRTDRGLLDSLRAYLDKYSHQCGIATSLETTLDARSGPPAAQRDPGHPGHPGGPDQRPQALGRRVGGRPDHAGERHGDLRRRGRRPWLRPERGAARPRRVRAAHDARADGADRRHAADRFRVRGGARASSRRFPASPRRAPIPRRG